MAQLQMNNFLILLLLANQSFQTISIKNVHITLGDHFINKNSNVVYRIGYKTNTQDDSIKAQVYFDNPESPRVYLTTKCRKYTKLDEDNKVDYSADFCFIDLYDLADPKIFSYRLISSEGIMTNLFTFKSNIISSKSPIIISFGDHDIIQYGIETKQALLKYRYDLIVFLGDLAYDIYDENGKIGDDYFESMESVFTQAPVVWTPGNHENYDDTLFLTTRLQMPGTVNPIDNNMFAFQVHEMLFVSFNLDLAFTIHPENYGSYVKQFETFLSETLKKTTSKFKVFFTHRPFYCSQYDMVDNDCARNPYYFRPFEELLQRNEFNLYLAGHVHYYERLSYMENFMITNENTHAVVLAGTGGNHEGYDDYDQFDVQFKKKTIYKTRGFLVINQRNNKISIDFTEVWNFDVLDSVFLDIDTPIDPSRNGYGIWILFSLFFILILLSVVLYHKTGQEKNLKEYDKIETVI